MFIEREQSFPGTGQSTGKVLLCTFTYKNAPDVISGAFLYIKMYFKGHI